MYESQTFEAILQRMLARIPDNLDKREGSVIYDALAPAAAELAQLYIACDYILAQSFADTANREYLVRRAAERGLYPEAASKARVNLRFTPESLDLTGRRFSCGSLNYVCVSSSAGDGVLECETAGSAANGNFGRAIPIDFISGLQTAEIVSVYVPGEDAEDTEVFRRRYVESFDHDAFGGNIADYILKTNSLDGVGATKVFPTPGGIGGTVKLVFLDSDYNSPSSSLVESVQNAVDPAPQGTGVGIAPIGHTVTVFGAIAAPIDVAATITLSQGASRDATTSRITAAVSEYFSELRKDWASQDHSVVRRAQVESRILAVPGVEDVTDLTLNDDEMNVILNSDVVPVLGALRW